MSNYTLGNQRIVLELLRQRSIFREGSFVLQHIESGIRILDVGCGLATITQGLHNLFSNLYLIGIDNDLNVLRKAKYIIQNKSSSFSTELIVSDVSLIPFPQESFDIVFGNTILMQLRYANIAVREIKRVLRTNGLIAFREPDYLLDEYSYEGFGYKFWKIFCELLKTEYGNPYIGSALRKIFKENGFEEISIGIKKMRVILSYSDKK